MTPLFFELRADESIELKLLVSGTHNSPSFGYTRQNIKADGFDILIEIESLIDADSKSSRLKSAAILLMSAIDVVRSYGPDLIMYAGDREEVMIGALLGGYLGIPTLHLYGGDHACDGHIDNPVRHAVSKLSTCHFVSTEEHRLRLLSLKEPSFRVFNIGSIALDKFRLVNKIDGIIEQVAQRKVNKPTAIVIYHPIEDEVKIADEIISNILNTLIDANFHCFVGLPNSDPGNIKIRNQINKLASEHESITVYGNLGREEFVSLFKSSALIVGNSSAGLLEAASIPIPCINVGARQMGRSCAGNVIFVTASAIDIAKGINKVTSEFFKSSIININNPYGDGYSANRAYSLIKSINFPDLLAKKEDPLNAK
jgi:UDP-hydrolysing UDP-N-acetyl-D-glucosamine 2-epimerase